jgi:hypothetical protein
LNSPTPHPPFFRQLASLAKGVYANSNQEYSMAEKLNAGTLFPPLSLHVGDGTLSLPQAKDSGYSIILFYRGHW